MTRFFLRCAVLVVQCVLAAHAAGIGPGTSAVGKSLSATPSFLFNVFPATGYAGQPRTLFLTVTQSVCEGFNYSLDTTLMQSQNVIVLRTTQIPLPCPTTPTPAGPTRFDFPFTPLKAGAITVRWDRGGPDVAIQTLAARVPSRYDVNGMWFDGATNGSGISIHHRRATSDVAFGTWFLFNNSGEARWYALQAASWQQDGSVLEGLLIGVEGSCPRVDLVACPAAGVVPRAAGNSYAVAPALVRITFQSPSRARAEVTTLNGTPLFSSELSRLAF